MYAAIRFLASILALLVGWATGLLALVGLVWVAWQFLSGIDFLDHLLTPPPPPIPLAIAVMVLPVLLLGLSLVLYACLPARTVMSLFVPGQQRQRLPDTAAVVLECRALAKRIGVRPPVVYVYADNALNAWALSSLIGSVIALSSGLLSALPPAQRQWVLAHELAHIKYFDSGAAAFWTAANRLVRFGWSLHRWLVNGTARVLDALRLPFVVWVMLCAPLFVLSYTLIAADAVARACFLLIDRWVGRGMEYRADHLACRLLGPAPGEGVMRALSAGIEPSFGLFATHPATLKRLRRIQRFAPDATVSAPQPASPASAGRGGAAPAGPIRTGAEAAAASGAPVPRVGARAAKGRVTMPEDTHRT